MSVELELSGEALKEHRAAEKEKLKRLLDEAKVPERLTGRLGLRYLKPDGRIG